MNSIATPKLFAGGANRFGLSRLRALHAWQGKRPEAIRPPMEMIRRRRAEMAFKPEK